MDLPTRELEETPLARGLVGLVLALLAADALAYMATGSPGGRALGILSLSLPLSVVFLRALPRGRVGLPLAATLAGALAGLVLAGWCVWDPSWLTALPWWPHSRPPNLLDDVSTLLSEGDPRGLAWATLLGAQAAFPLAYVTLRGHGLACKLVAGALGGVFVAAPLVVVGLPGTVWVGLAAAGAGAQSGLAASLLTRREPEPRPRPPGVLIPVALVLAAVWGVGLEALQDRPLPASPQLEEPLEACVAALETYREEHGHYPPTLGYLSGIDPDFGVGRLGNTLVYYATLQSGAHYRLVARPDRSYPGHSAWRGSDAEPLRDLGAAAELLRGWDYDELRLTRLGEGYRY